MNKTRIGFVMAAFAFAMLSTWTANVSADDCGCPACGVKICIPEAEIEKIKKTTFSVEEKDVCIPRFNWPWQKCCPPKCGHVRTVCVLKKESRECETCGYKWEFTTVEGAPTRDCKLKLGGHGLHGIFDGKSTKRRTDGCETGCATGWEMDATTGTTTRTLALPAGYRNGKADRAVGSVLKNQAGPESR